MPDAIDQAIQHLNEERARIDQAISVLEQYRQSRNGSAAAESSSGSLEDDLTVEQAVDRVLKLADRKLTVKEIVDRSGQMGKELNSNSVRWTLRHGVEAGRYGKTKDGRRMRYEMTE